MKALKKYLDENHKGDKFMDVPSDIRNKKGLVIASRAALEEIKEFYGADEASLFLRKGPSTYFARTDGFTPASDLAIFEKTAEILTIGMGQKTLNALAAFAETGGDDEDENEQLKSAFAAAMGYAIDGLPEEHKKKVHERIRKAMKKGSLQLEYLPDEIKGKPGEDDLLDELLS